MLSRNQIIQVIILMGKLLKNITHKEETKPVTKLKRDIRKFITHLEKHECSLHEDNLAVANRVWLDTQKKISNDDLVINMSDTISSLNVIIANEKYTKKSYSQKTFEKAYNSIVENTKIEFDEQVQKDSKKLIDLFIEDLGIEYNNGLKAKLAKLSQ